MNTIKFCAKCGTPIGPEEKFCGGCGASVAQMEAEAGTGSAPQAAPAQAPVQQTAQPDMYAQYAQPAYGQAYAPTAPKPNPFAKLGGWFASHKKLAVIIGAAVIVLIVAVIILCNILKYQVIDAKELFKIEYKGIDGCGTVEAELNCYDSYYYTASDAASLLGDYSDELDLDDLTSSKGKETVSKYFSLDNSTLKKAFSKAEDSKEARSMRAALLKQDKDGNYRIKLKIDDNKNLKNGDKVKCTVKYNEDSLKEKNIKLKNTEFELTVKGLKDGEEIDFFKDVNVTFSGFDGYGEASVEIAASSYPFIYYDYDYYTENLKNGDKFTVTCNLSAYDVQESGDKCWFEYDGKYYTYAKDAVKDNQITKEYTVEGLGETTTIDPFEGLEYNCSGGLPFVKISSVKEESINDKLRDYVYYSVECDGYIGEGATFKVMCSPNSQIGENGISLSGDTESDGWGGTRYYKEITVDGSFPAYVTSENGIAAMDSYQTLIDDKIQDLRKDIKGHYAPWGTDFDGKVESIESFDKVDTYVAFTNKKNYDSWEDVNRVIDLYKITVKTDDDKNNKATFYAAVYCRNIVADGETFTEDISLSTTYFNKESDFKKEMVDIEGYTVTKCQTGSSGSDKKEETPAETTTTTTAAAEKTDESKAETKAASTAENSKDSKAETTLVP